MELNWNFWGRGKFHSKNLLWGRDTINTNTNTIHTYTSFTLIPWSPRVGNDTLQFGLPSGNPSSRLKTFQRLHDLFHWKLRIQNLVRYNHSTLPAHGLELHAAFSSHWCDGLLQSWQTGHPVEKTGSPTLWLPELLAHRKDDGKQWKDSYVFCSKLMKFDFAFGSFHDRKFSCTVSWFKVIFHMWNIC